MHERGETYASGRHAALGKHSKHAVKSHRQAGYSGTVCGGFTKQAANISRPVVIRRWRPKAAHKALWRTTSIVYCTACCLRANTNSSVAAAAAAVSPVTRPVAKVTKNLASV